MACFLRVIEPECKMLKRELASYSTVRYSVIAFNMLLHAHVSMYTPHYDKSDIASPSKVLARLP